MGVLVDQIVDVLKTHPVMSVIFFIITFMFLNPLYLELKYSIKQKFFNPFKDTKLPPTSWAQPFGIPSFYNIMKSMRDENGPFYFKNKIFKSPSIKTARQQVLTTFIFRTIEPENIKTILATKFKDYSLGNRHSTFYPLLGDGIFTLDGAGWQHSRAILRPQFTRDQVSHVESLELHVQSLINHIEKSSKQGKFIDIQNLFFDFTIDTATEFLFGESLGMLTGGYPKIPLAKKFGESFKRAQKVLSIRFSSRSFAGLFTTKQFKEDCEICKTVTDEFVNMALERADKGTTSPDSYIFLDQLIQETRDPKILRDQSLNILVAGRDTTASLLSFVFMELSRRPEIYRKLRAEILSTFGDGNEKITFESLKKCVYLRYVINEALRMYPTVPFNFRYAIKDTVLPLGGGPDGKSPVFIPKGSTVTYSVFSVHRHTDHWGSDAEVFNPERWSDYNLKDHHAWDYLPFNGGPRICLGQQFALTEASYTITRILQKFETLETIPGLFDKEEIKVSMGITLHVGDKGVPVKMY